MSGSEYFYATIDDGTNKEIVKVTGVSSETWTVVRAQDGTSARTFANGVDVELRNNAAMLSDIKSFSAFTAAVTGTSGTFDSIVIGSTAITSTAAEINILDGVTSTTAELNILDGVTSTANELNILDGVTSTTAELNILDGVTSTAAEINLLDGSTANTVVNSKAVVYGSSGELAGALSTAAQPNVTSLGTLTALTGGTGDLNWDSGTLFVDSSADSVGIGTTSPAFENGTGLEIRYAGGNGAHLKLTDNASGTGATQGFDLYMFNSQAYIENYENAPIIFRQNGGESARFDSSGNLAIGTTTATATVTVSGNAVGTMITDNDGSFDMAAGNNFKCTPSGNFTLTFTNIISQSGNILLVNSGGHTVSAHTNSKVDANLLATVSTAGTYLISYFSDGTNVYLTNSAAYT